MSLFHTRPLLLYVRNGNSTLDAETMCAERSRSSLLSECLELFLVTTQLVGNSPAWPCALLFSCITELTVSHCANSKEEVHCRGPDITSEQAQWFHTFTHINHMSFSPEDNMGDKWVFGRQF